MVIAITVFSILLNSIDECRCCFWVFLLLFVFVLMSMFLFLFFLYIFHALNCRMLVLNMLKVVLDDGRVNQSYLHFGKRSHSFVHSITFKEVLTDLTTNHLSTGCPDILIWCQQTRKETKIMHFLPSCMSNIFRHHLLTNKTTNICINTP